MQSHVPYTLLGPDNTAIYLERLCGLPLLIKPILHKRLCDSPPVWESKSLRHPHTDGLHLALLSPQDHVLVPD